MRTLITSALIAVLLGALSCRGRDIVTENPPLCGWPVDFASVESSSLDNSYSGSVPCEPTIPGGDAKATYTDHVFTTGAYRGNAVRLIVEEYSTWGQAHEALGKRIIGAGRVCQTQHSDNRGEVIDSDGSSTRVIAHLPATGVDRDRIEILTAQVDTWRKGSRLQIVVAPSIEVALVYERAMYMEDF